jgi:hypothetical protein
MVFFVGVHRPDRKPVFRFSGFSGFPVFRAFDGSGLPDNRGFGVPVCGFSRFRFRFRFLFRFLPRLREGAALQDLFGP